MTQKAALAEGFPPVTTLEEYTQGLLHLCLLMDRPQSWRQARALEGGLEKFERDIIEQPLMRRRREVVPGQGLEPRRREPKSLALPIRRPRNSGLCDGN